MAYPPLRSQLVLLLSVLAMACGHKIGDECTTSVDCSQGGERLCDVTQPGGYCTVFNCEPDTCPEEASCIAFGASLSIVPACQDKSGLSRLERAFCMRTCGSDADCRGGYRCVNVASADNAWRNALPIDPDRSSKVCLADGGVANESPAPASPNVCTGPEPGSGGSASGGASSGGASSGGTSAGGTSSAGAGGSDAGSTGEGGSSESAGAGGSGG